MTAATLNFLKSIPAAPRVALLPDHRFFVRQVPVVAGATAAEVASQIELALEGLSPFPPAQLYHGYYWVPGAGYALVFATYRKRFTTDETAEWSAAELLVPAFVGVFGLEHEPATTVIYTGADSLTAVHWEEGEVPSTVVIREIMAEATEEERAKVREEMLRGLGGSRKVIDLVAPPDPVSSSDEQGLSLSGGRIHRAPAGRCGGGVGRPGQGRVDGETDGSHARPHSVASFCRLCDNVGAAAGGRDRAAGRPPDLVQSDVRADRRAAPGGGEDHDGP